MEIKTGKKRKPAKNRVERNPKLLIIALLLAGVILLAGVGLTVFFVFRGEEPEPLPEPEQPVAQEETQPEPVGSDLGSDVVNHIVTAGGAVLDNFQQRPATHELTEENRANFAKITECVIKTETGRVSVTVTGDGIPMSDD